MTFHVPDEKLEEFRSVRSRYVTSLQKRDEADQRYRDAALELERAKAEVVTARTKWAIQLTMPEYERVGDE